MVAFVDYDLTVLGDDVLHLVFAHQTLDHRHIQSAVPGLLACSDLANLLGF
jgi:hypothetical protein